MHVQGTARSDEFQCCWGQQLPGHGGQQSPKQPLVSLGRGQDVTHDRLRTPTGDVPSVYVLMQK